MFGLWGFAAASLFEVKVLGACEVSLPRPVDSCRASETEFRLSTRYMLDKVSDVKGHLDAPGGLMFEIAAAVSLRRQGMEDSQKTGSEA